MEKLLCFVAVDFVDDMNVSGYKYWYLCDDGSVKEKDIVAAPLGRHNNIQYGIVRKVLFAYEESAPYPTEFIKRIKKIVREEKNV